jgi:tetratricopeptide (TPR) repeat protein
MRRIISISDDPARALLQGKHFLDTGEFKTAAECFEKSLECEPGIIEAQYYLARSHFYLGNDGIAVRIYNSLRRNRDAEAEVSCALLRRCFDLREGDPLSDVTMLTQKEANAIRDTEQIVLEHPKLFAHLRWIKSTNKYEDLHYQLSIVNWWPDKRWYCTIALDESILESFGFRRFEPVWYCSPILFDAHIARQLFLQRVLIDMRDSGKDPWPPTVYVVDIPFPQSRRLLERVYPELQPRYPTPQLNLFSAK